MTNAKHERPASGPVSVRAFAERIGLREATLIRWCRAGRIEGARRHPLTGKWWIHPPAKIVQP